MAPVTASAASGIPHSKASAAKKLTQPGPPDPMNRTYGRAALETPAGRRVVIAVVVAVVLIVVAVIALQLRPGDDDKGPAAASPSRAQLRLRRVVGQRARRALRRPLRPVVRRRRRSDQERYPQQESFE